MDNVLIALLGLIAGSFLGLCVYRLPRLQSLVKPGSRCPACGHALSWTENLPLAGFLWQRGRCRRCAAPIPWSYALVEAATAAAFLWSWRRSGGGLEFVREAFFLGCLVALAATDLELRQLPDELTLGGWAAGLAFAAWQTPTLASLSPLTPQPNLVEAVVASFGAAGLLALLGIAGYRWLRGRAGMGWGDIKMMGLLGAFLGTASVYLALCLAAVAAAVVGLLLALQVLSKRLRQRRGWRRAWAGTAVYIARSPIPFGVFLAAGGALALAWGPQLWHWLVL